MNDFCPFINGKCNNNCKFKITKTATSYDISDCLIFVKLDTINDLQKDQLTDISTTLAKR